MPEPEPEVKVPSTVRAVALLVAAEGVALLVLAVLEGITPLTQDADKDVQGALVTAAFSALGGALLLLLARAVSRGRTVLVPALVVQLIMLPIGWNLIGASGRPEYGVPVLLVALAVLGLLATPSARAVLARSGPLSGA